MQQVQNSSTRKAILLLAIWVLTAIALLPVFFHWMPPVPVASHAAHLQLDLAYLCAVAICFWMYRSELKRLSRGQAQTLVFLVFILTSVTNNVHRNYVDHSSIFASTSNLAWQIDLQNQVMRLSPAVAPHSYRFLPNAIVRWMELFRMSYESARDVYRLILGILLFYATYRYARLFTSYGGAVLALLLVTVIYPVSFEYSAGQLTDPLSHLSFVLAFIFLETGDFALLLTTLLIGSLAKETVLAMAGYYVLFCRRDRGYAWKATTLCVSVLAFYLAVRAFVLHGSAGYRYEQVSGVAPAHVWANLGSGRWQGLLLLTVGSLVPFLVLGWKRTARSLKQQAIFLFPVLFISGTLFSWLFETRNFMPLVFVLAMAAGNYFSQLFAEGSGGENA